ncbi:alpha/beta fold hydrolase [Amycolatopsis taiwanensis]|uniref:alpha/beta fold hydrolase n=1 Tax=Amycolatopsis taiwanensis TaxID=342230 RepID=UPI000480306F|nr:alpha/beta hydrolase [Amycolatopsis taiwanensis]
MTSAIARPSAVLLPGTGSDEIFVRSVFAGPLAVAGVGAITPPPPPGELVGVEYLKLLDMLADAGPLIVGGISFGAHLAVEWAVRNRHRCAGLLLALPAWHGEPGRAPASLAAMASADLVAAQGLEEALRRSTAGVAPWLAAELARAWRRHGHGLAASLRAAAARPAPPLSALRTLDVPAGIAACTDDPVHPLACARAWARALPRAALVETTLAALGEDRESLGRAAVLAWQRASRS